MGMDLFLSFPWTARIPHLTHLACREKRGQAGRGSEQPGLVEGVPALAGGLEPDDL